MSIRAINWALAAETGKPTAKLVLWALANYADDDGICWPAQKLIARITEMSVDSVQRRLADLECDGLIERERRYMVATVRVQQIGIIYVWILNRNLRSWIMSQEKKAA